MKTIINYFLLLIVFLLILLCHGCQKKKWKKPAHITCSLELDNSSTGLIKIHYGNFTVEEVAFDGTRKQGANNISFEKKYDGGSVMYTPYYQPAYTSTYISYYTSYYQSYLQSGSQASPSIITFDIPQGTYTNFDLELKLKTINNNQSLVLHGTYTNSFFMKIPVVFTLEAGETIIPVAKTSNGGTEFVFVEGQTYAGKIVFNSTHWFESISKNMLESANLTSVGWGWGNNVMYIDKTNNTNIYDIVVARIKSDSEIIFN